MHLTNNPKSCGSKGGSAQLSNPIYCLRLLAVVHVHTYLLVTDADAAHTKSQTGAAVSANEEMLATSLYNSKHVLRPGRVSADFESQSGWICCPTCTC